MLALSSRGYDAVLHHTQDHKLSKMAVGGARIPEA
jgi:hypothetical protein